MEAAIRAIAEPRRREILRLVRDDELTAGAIAERFAVSRPAISQHLKVLREAGLVSERRQGTRRFYRARPETIAALRDYLESFWDDQLERLRYVAEHAERRRSGMTTAQTDVVREVRIAARPETVFACLTEADRIPAWMGRRATLEARSGGLYRVEINDMVVARGEVREVVPNRRLVFSFGWEGEGSAVPPGSTTVEISIEPDGEGTLVRLVHTGLPEAEHEQHGQGWEMYLGRLATAATGGNPGPDPNSGAM